MNDDNYSQALLEKWKPVLDHEDMPKIRDSHRRSAMAMLLENQAKANAELLSRDRTMSLTYLLEGPTNSMGASSSTAGAGNVDIYDPVMISMVRRAMPNLIAYDVCGVQPMSGPTGLVFALTSKYTSQTGTEALFNEANTTFGAAASANAAGITAVGGAQTGSNPADLIVTGNTAYTTSTGAKTAAAENFGFGNGNQMPEMAFEIAKISVTADSRALKAEYSHELQQDLKQVHGLDAETELSNILSAEILAEINRQVIRSIYITATTGAQVGTQTAGYFDLDIDSNGRWSVEKWKGLLFQIEREANAIGKATRRGKGNFVITTSDVASALAMAGYLDYSSALSKEKLEVDDTGNTFAGTLFGKIKVFVDPYADTGTNQAVAVGYKGQSPWDAGIFYCPYVPLQMYRAVGENTFQPKIAFKTRYGLAAHPLATTAKDGLVHVNKKNTYYRIFAAKNLM